MTAARRRPCGRLLPAALAATAVVAAAGCNAPVKVHGNMPDPETISKIEAGRHGRSDVVELLGSPSATSTFQDKTWYYIGSKEQQFAFFQPDVLEQNVLEISFDEGDRVASTQVYTLKDGRPITPVDRVTPTEGRDLTVLQQLFGNLGRFNPDTAGGTPGAPGPTTPGPGRP